MAAKAAIIRASIGRRAALGVAGALAAPVARGEAWPSRPVRLIVPAAAGNQIDLVARVLADGLGARWGQRIVVENLSGAGGAIGVAQIARAVPDGYTIGIIAIAALAIIPHMQATPYDPLADLVPLGGVAVTRSALVTSPALPVTRLDEFVALARTRGEAEPLFYGSPGNGTVPHLGAEMLRRALDFPATHMPYRTAAAAMADLVAGRVQFAFDNLTVTLPQIEAARLRALFVNAPQRLPQLPDVPALAEAAPGLDLPNPWQALHTPRNFPADIATRVAADLAALIGNPALAPRMPHGSEQLPMTAAATAVAIRADHARFGALVKELGLQSS